MQKSTLTTPSATGSTKPLYPPDWSTIALRIKQKANWTCTHCPTKQSDNPHNNITVHHIDHNTFNNEESNLLVLCQLCHLREEKKYHRHLKRERLLNYLQASGQLIFEGFDPYPLIE